MGPEKAEDRSCDRVVQGLLFLRYNKLFSPFFSLYYIWIVGERNGP